MIFFIGLPRCGGQSINQVMKKLYPHLDPWHSVEADKWDAKINHKCSAIVECFAPLNWCIKCPIRKPHTFVYNHRDVDSWYESCIRFRDRAKERRWNHPLWNLSECQWRDYHAEHAFSAFKLLKHEMIELKYVSVWECKTVKEFADKCGLPCPSGVGNFLIPNVDRYGRLVPGQLPQFTNSENVNTFNSFLGGSL
jgi:hypothetical protein